jgi:Leucine-rich repeat (LRR) protein
MEDVSPARRPCLLPPEPPMTHEEAQKEAIHRIHNAHLNGVDWLDLGDLPIENVPEEIRILKDQLWVLALGNEKPVWREGTLEWDFEHWRPGLVWDVGPLGTLTGLTTLNLEGTGLADVGPLGTLTGLTTLELSECEGLTDIGPLGTLTGLTTLYLNSCKGLTDVGPLGILTGLTTLALSDCKGLTDVGPLGTLTGLTTLNLAGTGLTDVGPLGTLTGLTTLYLSDCEGLTDVGPLGTLTGLTTLDLSRLRGSDGCRPAGHIHRAHHALPVLLP